MHYVAHVGSVRSRSCMPHLRVFFAGQSCANSSLSSVMNADQKARPHGLRRSFAESETAHLLVGWKFIYFQPPRPCALSQPSMQNMAFTKASRVPRCPSTCTCAHSLVQDALARVTAWIVEYAQRLGTAYVGGVQAALVPRGNLLCLIQVHRSPGKAEILKSGINAALSVRAGEA